jgi:hypothetical protein
MANDAPGESVLCRNIRIRVPLDVMRHADIRTTMNVYGDAARADMQEAHGKIVVLALNGLQTDCKPS